MYIARSIILLVLASGSFAAEMQKAEHVERLSLLSNWLKVARGEIEHESVLGVSYVLSHDRGNKVDYVMATRQWIYDYHDVWLHEARENLRFKTEINLGARLRNGEGLVASMGIAAMYFPEKLKTRCLSPYVEAGIGLIYTDFGIEGQGLRLNFNPQIGVGTRIEGKTGDYFVSLRAHHLSNGGLYDENRGINSVVFFLGRAF